MANQAIDKKSISKWPRKECNIGAECLRYVNPVQKCFFGDNRHIFMYLQNNLKIVISVLGGCVTIKRL